MDGVNDEMVAGYIGGCYAEDGIVIHDSSIPESECAACDMLHMMIHGGDE